jgi:hypothetical protein
MEGDIRQSGKINGRKATCVSYPSRSTDDRCLLLVEVLTSESWLLLKGLADAEVEGAGALSRPDMIELETVIEPQRYVFDFDAQPDAC